uniref:Ubiquitin-like protease family profile domain-containing protein n=1 Tax=Oryza punctata TaxID=4537 RepID=A0A0E0M0P4_ORYPU
MASLKFVREVATSISEPLKEHFTRGTDAAMVVLSPAGEATNHAPDLAVGPLIRELAVNYEGKSASKDFLSTCNEGEPSENTSSGTDCDDVLVLKRKLKSLKRKYRQLKESMMRNEIVSAPDHFHEENSRRFTSSIKDLANVFVKLIPFKRRMDPKASPVKDEANCIGHFIPNNLASLEAPSFSLGLDYLDIEEDNEQAPPQPENNCKPVPQVCNNTVPTQNKDDLHPEVTPEASVLSSESYDMKCIDVCIEAERIYNQRRSQGNYGNLISNRTSAETQMSIMTQTVGVKLDRQHASWQLTGKGGSLKAIRLTEDEFPHVRFSCLGQSLKPDGEVQNFVINSFCRLLFLDHHPSRSKKHYFFNKVGGQLLISHNEFKCCKVEHAFRSAHGVKTLQSSEMTQFPIIHEDHWFLFIANMKDKKFVFIDSLHTEDHTFHRAIKANITANAKCKHIATKSGNW